MELSALKTSQLRRRAADDTGVDGSAVEEADDSDDPREALILLLLDASEAEAIEAGAAWQASAAAAKALRADLSSLKKSQLRRRAAGGVLEIEEHGVYTAMHS